MFSYLGAKTKIVDRYPEPKYKTIIEPFCGSAKYALKYWDNEIFLFDINPHVIGAWRFLIEASVKDILRLPILKEGENVHDFTTLSNDEKSFIGFNLCPGKSKPRARFYGWNGWTEQKRKSVANDLYKIKHWQIAYRDYKEIANNPTATYFIDPPYQVKQQTTTEPYCYRTINYEHLAEWIKNRNGQVIACAGEGDNYLPFEYFTLTGSTSNRMQMEYIYTQENGI